MWLWLKSSQPEIKPPERPLSAKISSGVVKALHCRSSLLTLTFGLIPGGKGRPRLCCTHRGHPCNVRGERTVCPALASSHHLSFECRAAGQELLGQEQHPHFLEVFMPPGRSCHAVSYILNTIRNRNVPSYPVEPPPAFATMELPCQRPSLPTGLTAS